MKIEIREPTLSLPEPILEPYTETHEIKLHAGERQSVSLCGYGLIHVRTIRLEGDTDYLYVQLHLGVENKLIPSSPPSHPNPAKHREAKERWDRILEDGMSAQEFADWISSQQLVCPPGMMISLRLYWSPPWRDGSRQIEVTLEGEAPSA